jgi:hypothetical protein
MTRTKGQKFLLAATLLAAGLAAFILHGGLGRTSDFGADSATGQVRMEVDTTVIPSDAPPASLSEPPASLSAPEEGPSAQAPQEEPVPGNEDAAVSPPVQTAAPDAAPASAPAKASAKTPAKAPAKAKAPAPGKTPGKTPAAREGIITSASLESAADGFVLTVVCDRPAGETAVMTLSSPDRVVLDLLGPWRLKAPNVIREASGPVRHVVVGAHPDRMRFVVHFRDDAPLPVPGGIKVERAGNVARMTVPLAR